MPINKKYIETFVENGIFHIFCKAVGNNVLFKNDENRYYFLKKYALYSKGYLETYSYVLLDNHVHWLVKCTGEKSLTEFIGTIPPGKQKLHQVKYNKRQISYEQAIEFQCKDFFIAYAMAFNKQYNRAGALFISPFKRVQVKTHSHFTQLIIYHHANVVKHGICSDFENYPWSSYKSLLSEKTTLLQRSEVLEWFGGKDRFVKTHREITELYYKNHFSLE